MLDFLQGKVYPKCEVGLDVLAHLPVGVDIRVFDRVY